MKINICAIGRIKSSPEADMVNDYVDRFERIGKNIGLGPIKIIEKESKKRLHSLLDSGYARVNLKKLYFMSLIILLIIWINIYENNRI